MPRKQEKKEIVPPEEQCLNRLTSEKTIQLFGDGIHKFFLEMRCTDRRIEGKPICLKCSMPNTSIKQYARTFPRGLIHEPLPPTVHLFDSEWYHQGVKKWGSPSEEVITLAIQFQEEARKVQEPSVNSESMPPKRNTVAKRPVVKKPEESEEKLPELTISEEVSKKPIKKIPRPRKKKMDVSELPPPMDSSYPPSLSPHSSVLQLFHQKEEQEEKEKEEKEEKERKKERKPRAPAKTKKTETKKTETKTASVHPLSALHRDFCIPTHMEEKMEEYSISDYETETVPLSIFILDTTVYFRDVKKNKLYRRIKETIGSYVGRYDPQTDSLVTDIPDSDDEE